MAFDSSKAEQIKSVLAERLDADKDDSHPVHLDGVISRNDYVAKNIADELDKLGYTGSSADINPSISISGIVDSITGKKDLKRRQCLTLRRRRHRMTTAIPITRKTQNGR